MTVEPFELIANYVRHNDPHIRRNVAVAIGTLANKEGVSALLDMASWDPDAEVRDEAERQLASLDGELAPLVRAELSRRVHDDDAAKRTVANGVAGRLYLRGFDLRAPDQRLFRRVRQVWRERVSPSTVWQVLAELAQRFHQAGMSRRFSIRTVWGGVLGAAAPFVLLSLYLGTTLGPRTNVYYEYMAFGMFCIVAMTLRVGRRDVPMILQWDEPAAIARDVAETTIWTMVLVTPLTALLLASADSLQLKPAVMLGLLAGGTMSLALAAVHLGSATLAHQSKAGTYARFQRYFVGVSSGLACLTAGLFIARRFSLADHQARLAEGLWLYGVPACGALALILARQDTTSLGISIANRRRRRTRRLAAIFLAVPAVVALAFGTWKALQWYVPTGRSLDDAFGSVPWETLSGKASEVKLRWRPPQTTYRFRLPFPQRIRFSAAARPPGSPQEADGSLVWTIRAPKDSPGDASQGLCSWTDRDLTQVASQQLSPAGQDAPLLAAGCYELQVTAPALGTPASMWHVLDARTARERAAAAARVQDLHVAVNEDGAAWVTGVQAAGVTHPIAWVAKKEDPPLSLEIGEPVTVTVFAAHGSTTFREALTSDLSDDPEIKITRDGGQARPEAVPNGNTLQPGRYSISAKPRAGAAPSVSVYLAFSPAMQRLTWTVAAAPSRFRLKLDAASHVVAELSHPSSAPDLALALVRLDGGRIAYADDPEIVRTDLAAGEYELIVDRYNRPSQPSDTATLTFPDPLRLRVAIGPSQRQSAPNR
jgi:hypothetical protein